MKVYLIEWQKFINDYLIIAFRVPSVKAWCAALINPVKQLHSAFITYREFCLYRVRHNCQIVYMEAVLNDHFDNELRRIRIINSEFKEGLYFYEPEENKEVYFYEPEENKPVYFHEPDGFDGNGVDFIVCVPPDLQPADEPTEIALTTRMKGQIDYYKLYSKNYKIVWVLADI